MFLHIVILMLTDITQSSVRFSHFVNLWLISMIAIVLRLFIWIKFLIYEPICVFNKVDDDKSTYLRIRTQIATNEYASSVPMDMRSTRAARSNRKAISAVRRKPDFRKTHSVDANVYSHFKTHRNCWVFSCRFQEALSILNRHPDRHAETRQRRAGSLIKTLLTRCDGRTTHSWILPTDMLPAMIPETMVARMGVFVRAFIRDRIRNSSPSSAMA